MTGLALLACGSNPPAPATGTGPITTPPASASAITNPPSATNAPSSTAPPSSTSGPAPGVVCTMDAKRCPDGTEVGRSGPRCEFVCPEPKDAPGESTDGKLCSQSSECGSGEVCVGAMGCKAAWHCEKKACTRDLRPYCGCDGKTFQASGSCPGARHSKRGPC